MLGVIYFAEKDLNKAEEILLQGTMFDSRNFFLHYNLGYLYYLSKNIPNPLSIILELCKCVKTKKVKKKF